MDDVSVRRQDGGRACQHARAVCADGTANGVQDEIPGWLGGGSNVSKTTDDRERPVRDGASGRQDGGATPRPRSWLPGSDVDEATPNRRTPRLAGAAPDSTRMGTPTGRVPAVPVDRTQFGAPTRTTSVDSNRPTSGAATLDDMTAAQDPAPRDGSDGEAATMFGVHVRDAAIVDKGAASVGAERTAFGMQRMADAQSGSVNSGGLASSWAEDTCPEGPGLPAYPDSKPRVEAGDWLDDVSAWLKGEPDAGDLARRPLGNVRATVPMQAIADTDVARAVRLGAAESGAVPNDAAASPSKRVMPTQPVDRLSMPPSDGVMPTQPVDRLSMLPSDGVMPTQPVDRLSMPSSDEVTPERSDDPASMVMQRPGTRRKRSASAEASFVRPGVHATASNRKDDMSAAIVRAPRERASDAVRVPETVAVDAQNIHGATENEPSHGSVPDSGAVAFADTGVMPALAGAAAPRVGVTTVPDAAFSIVDAVGSPSSSAHSIDTADTRATDQTLVMDMPEATASSVGPSQQPARRSNSFDETLVAHPVLDGAGDVDSSPGVDPGETRSVSLVPIDEAPTPEPAQSARFELRQMVGVAVVVIGALVGAALALGLLISR